MPFSTRGAFTSTRVKGVLANWRLSTPRCATLATPQWLRKSPCSHHERGTRTSAKSSPVVSHGDYAYTHQRSPDQRVTHGDYAYTLRLLTLAAPGLPSAKSSSSRATYLPPIITTTGVGECTWLHCPESLPMVDFLPSCNHMDDQGSGTASTCKVVFPLLELHLHTQI